jgi:hypothetical protein
MSMPDPSSEHRLFSVEDFLETTGDENKKNTYAALVEPLSRLGNLIQSQYATPDGLPGVCILKNARVDETYLGDLIQTIVLTDGLLDFHMSVGSRTSQIVIEPSLLQPLGPMSVAKIGVMWAYA